MRVDQIPRTLHLLLLTTLTLAVAPALASDQAQRSVADARGTHQNPTGGVNAARWQAADHLVLVSFDGFRPDYIDRLRPPAFLALAAEGVRAQASIPPFPSKTFPSHYSIATGLWAEHHGITGNRFHDPVRGDYSSRDRDAVMDGSWYRGEPIWVTAERQGMVAASYFFVGSEADVAGVRPSYWFPYDGDVSGEQRVEQALAWLRMPSAERPRVITLYFSDVDSIGHRFGPDSDEVAAAVARVDGHLGRLMAGIHALPHGDRVNVLLVSDHGMAPWSLDGVHGVDLSDLEDLRMVEGGPYASFTVASPDPARHAAVRDALAAQLPDRVAVYTRADLPARLHYASDPRAGDLVAVPPLGETVYDAARLPERGGFNHGWDPRHPDMHGIFLARGPLITAGATLPPIRHVDIYALMTRLLGLLPAANDGDGEVFTPALRPAADH